MGLSLVSLLSSVAIFLALLQLVNGNAEVKTLMEIKTTLDPENRFLSSWTSDGDPCSGSFEGVACNELGKVANISLQGKGLYGSIPSAISRLKSLTGLYLHYNSLKGEIPREISNLTQLSDLYLNVNNLSGSIPVEIGSMANLQVLQLCYNQLTGSIPTHLGFLKKLSVLALQSNRLTGAIPASLGDLTELMRLDLSYNQLFGSIPIKVSNIPQLQVFNVRNNTLSGSVPSALKRLNGGFQYGNNSNLCGAGFSSLRGCLSSDLLNPNRPEPIESKEIPQSANFGSHCGQTHCSNPSKASKVAVVFGVITVMVVGLVVGFFSFSWYRRQKQKIGSTFDVTDSRLSTDQAKDFNRKSISPLISLEYSNGWDPLADAKCGGEFSHEVFQSLRFSLEDVESATQYFSEVNLLGKSNFAPVYRGILRDGSVVAVKSINKTSCKSEEAEFLKGLKILASVRHDNLVGLRGFCCSRGRGECFLVYDFVANGSLLHYLDVMEDSHRVLDWTTRVSIVNGIAKGIEYLHGNRANKPALVHQNISAEKILIDQHYKPLLSDSGLHKLLADDVVFSILKASAAMGYLAPEYTTTGRFTEKSDVYAFGVVLFQILTGKSMITVSVRSAAESAKLVDLIDANLHGKFSEPEAENLARIAVACTSEAPNHRPKMGMVVEELIKFSDIS